MADKETADLKPDKGHEQNSAKRPPASVIKPPKNK
jgi:hypothetical protein